MLPPPNARPTIPPSSPDIFDSPLVLGLGAPRSDDVAAWLADAPTVRAAVGSQGRVLALGGISGTGITPSETGDLRFTLAPGALGEGEQLSLGFLEFDATGAGLTLLHLELEADGRLIFDERFENVADASLELDDQVRAITTSEFVAGNPLELVLGFDLSIAGAADHFATRLALFASAVAEPQSGALLALVLLALWGGLRWERAR
jgi:hypothetical protein